MSNGTVGLAEAFKELRSHRRLTQSEMAAQLGVSLPTVQRYERYGPATDALLTLASKAREWSREDLAEKFNEAFRQQHGITEAQQEPADYTPDEQRWISVLVRALRSAKNEGLQHLLGTLEMLEKLYPPSTKT